MIVYYVEEDFGHLMTEEMNKPRWRRNVRGHCFSFIMPWETILKDLTSRIQQEDLIDLPRDDECLSYLVRFHLRVAGKDFHQHLKQVHLRPFVLVLLLHELIDNNHPVFKSSMNAALLKERMRACVEAKFPETETGVPLQERHGTVPPKVRELLQGLEAETSSTDRIVPTTLRKMVTFEKHAVPGSGAAPANEAFDDIRPRSFLLDKNPMAFRKLTNGCAAPSK